MTTAIGYVRVSTKKQDISLEAQEAQIRGMCAVKGLALAEIIVDRDEFSGNLNRPGAQRVLEMVKAKQTGAVIIAKLDRLTRSTRDAIDLIELFSAKDVELISVAESLDTHSPMGRFFVRMIASIGELEREMTSQRTSIALQHQKANGFPAGPAPYGWVRLPKVKGGSGRDVSQPLVESPDEQAVIIRVRAMRAAGQSCQEIAVALNADGVATRKGTAWKKQYIGGIISQ